MIGKPFIGLGDMHFLVGFIFSYLYDEKYLEFIFINLRGFEQFFLVQFELEIVNSFIKHFHYPSRNIVVDCIGGIFFSKNIKRTIKSGSKISISQILVQRLLIYP